TLRKNRRVLLGRIFLHMFTLGLLYDLWLIAPAAVGNYLRFIKFTISFTIISLSLALLSATNNAKAAKVLSLIFRSPVLLLNSASFWTKNSMKTNEPIRLLPS